MMTIAYSTNPALPMPARQQREDRVVEFVGTIAPESVSLRRDSSAPAAPGGRIAEPSDLPASTRPPRNVGATPLGPSFDDPAHRGGSTPHRPRARR